MDGGLVVRMVEKLKFAFTIISEKMFTRSQSTPSTSMSLFGQMSFGGAATETSYFGNHATGSRVANPNKDYEVANPSYYQNRFDEILFLDGLTRFSMTIYRRSGTNIVTMPSSWCCSFVLGHWGAAQAELPCRAARKEGLNPALDASYIMDSKGVFACLGNNQQNLLHPLVLKPSSSAPPRAVPPSSAPA